MIANIADNFVWKKGFKTYAIASYCLLSINLSCNVILALIINTICTKCLQLKPSDAEMAMSTSSITESLAQDF
jgi:hypothetical protein